MPGALSFRFHGCGSEDDLPPTETDESAPAPWQEFARVRNALLSGLRPFGSVGPLGEAPIYEGDRRPDDGWSVESNDPDYFVRDDHWRATERYQCIEVPSSRLITLEVLDAIAKVVTEHPSWGVGIGVPSLRYFYLAKGEIWFHGTGLQPFHSLREALSAPLAECRPAPLRSQFESRVSRSSAIVAGVLLGLLGLVFAISGFGLLVHWLANPSEPAGIAVVFAVFGLVGTCSLFPSWRLVTGRARADGGLFPPLFLYAAALVLGALAVFKAFWVSPFSAVVPGVIATGCIIVARRRSILGRPAI